MAEISALTQEQLCYFSRQFSNMFGLPVRLYRKQACVYTYLPVQLVEDPAQLCRQVILERTESILSRAAIEAGVNPDEVLSAEEKYVSKCEPFVDIDRIKNLQYHMILDYADRVRKLQQYHGDCSRSACIFLLI